MPKDRDNNNNETTIKKLVTIPNMVIIANLLWSLANVLLTNKLAPMAESISKLEVKANTNENAITTTQQQLINHIKENNESEKTINGNILLIMKDLGIVEGKTIK